MALVTAIVGAAIIGAAATVYASEKQEDIAEKEQKRLEEEEARRKAEAERIAKETRPEGEELQSIGFGSEASKAKAGSTSDFLIPKKATALGGTTGKSGLGFNV